jgi:ribosomal protein L40E
MGRFPEADAELAEIKICLRCKTRNSVNRKKCRKCGSTYFRPKRRDIRTKR